MASERTRHTLAALGIAGLLTYPLPTAVAGLALLLLSWWLRLRATGKPFATSVLDLPLGLFVSGMVLAFVVGVRTPSSEVRLYGMFAAVGAFYLARELGYRKRTSARLRDGAIMAVAVLLPFLIVLVAPELRDGRLLLPMAESVREVVRVLADVGQELRETVQVPQRSTFYRFHSSGLGALAAVGVALCLGPILAGASRRSRLLGGLLLVYCLAVLLLSGNRGAVISMLSVGALVLASRVRRSRLAGAGLSVAAVLVVGGLATILLLDGAAAPVLPDAPGALSHYTLLQRFEVWQNALFLVGDFRFTGVGLGISTVAWVYESYFPPQVLRMSHMHNIVLQSYLEQGLLGFVGTLGLLFGTLILGVLTLLLAARHPNSSVAVSFASAALVLAACGLTDIVPATSIGMLLYLGALGGLTAQHARLAEPTRSALARDDEHRLSVPVRRQAAMSRRVWMPVGVIALALLAAGFSFGSPAAGISVAVESSSGSIVRAVQLNLAALELASFAIERAASEPSPSAPERLRRAHELLESAASRQPDHPDVLRLRAMLEVALGRRDRAEQLLTRAEQAAPEHDRYWFQLGRLYREAGSVDGAISAWSRVDPGLGARTRDGPIMHLVVWGEALAREGQWREAEAINIAAIRTSPTSVAPYRHLARAVEQRNGPREAIAAMHSLVETYPYVPWPCEELARLYRTIGQTDQAASWGSRGRTVYASPEWAAAYKKAAAAGRHVTRQPQ